MARQNAQIVVGRLQICRMNVDPKPVVHIGHLSHHWSLLFPTKVCRVLVVTQQTITTTPNEIKHLADIAQNESHEQSAILVHDVRF